MERPHITFLSIWVAGDHRRYVLHDLLVPLSFDFGRRPADIALPRLNVVWLDQGVQYLLLTIVTLGLSALAFVILERPFMVPGWPRQALHWCRTHPYFTCAAVTV